MGRWETTCAKDGAAHGHEYTIHRHISTGVGHMVAWVGRSRWIGLLVPMQVATSKDNTYSSLDTL